MGCSDLTDDIRPAGLGYDMGHEDLMDRSDPLDLSVVTRCVDLQAEVGLIVVMWMTIYQTTDGIQEAWEGRSGEKMPDAAESSLCWQSMHYATTVQIFMS